MKTWLLPHSSSTKEIEINWWKVLRMNHLGKQKYLIKTTKITKDFWVWDWRYNLIRKQLK
jgi:hypothetical protein